MQTGQTDLLGLLDARRKRDVQAIARTLVVTSDALTNLILAGRVGFLSSQYRYQCHFDEVMPPELELKQENLEAMGRNGVGELKGKALSASRKMKQAFTDRRLLCVHLFYSLCHRYWHLFYFDQRDTTGSRNHWKHGPHIHYASDLTCRTPLPEVWKAVCARPAKFPKPLHLRFDYHHNPRHLRGTPRVA